jgi:hypothetical protein
MEAYLELLSAKKVIFESLIEKEFDLNKCVEAYASLNHHPQPMAVLFKYDQKYDPSLNKKHLITFNPKSNQNVNGKIKVALIGVGNFVMSTHMPNLLKLKNIYEIRGVCVDNSVKANE